MAFDITALLLGMQHDLSLGSIKGLSERDVGILMCIAIDHDFITRYIQIYAHIEGVALMFVVVRHFDRDVAACQIGMQLSQRFHFFADVIFERLGAGHAVKCDVHWN